MTQIIKQDGTMEGLGSVWVLDANGRAKINAHLLDGLHADATGAADAHVVATDANGDATVVDLTASGGLNVGTATGAGTGEIFADGDVGIGTTNPDAYYNTNSSYQLAGIDGDDKWLTVQGGSGTPPVLNLENGLNVDGGVIGGVIWTRTGGQGDAHRNVAGIVGVQVGTGATCGAELQFWTKSVAGPERKMTINWAGRVLIGTTSDDGINKLQVSGSIKASGDISGASYQFSAGAGGGLRYLRVNGTQLLYYNGTTEVVIAS